MDIIVSPLMLAINNNYDNRKQRSAAFMPFELGLFLRENRNFTADMLHPSNH